MLNHNKFHICPTLISEFQNPSNATTQLKYEGQLIRMPCSKAQPLPIYGCPTITAALKENIPRTKSKCGSGVSLTKQYQVILGSAKSLNTSVVGSPSTQPYSPLHSDRPTVLWPVFTLEFAPILKNLSSKICTCSTALCAC